MILKEENKIIVSCNCCDNLGCGNLIIFHQAFGQIWISSNSSDFYTQQLNIKATLEKKIERLKKSYKNKYNYFGEVILSKKELEELLKHLKKITLEINEDDKTFVNNEKVTIHLEYIKDENTKEPEFLLSLKGKISISEILRNKEYQFFETSYSKEKMLKYIEGVERALKKIEKEQKE